jgi:hypothetical protein
MMTPGRIWIPWSKWYYYMIRCWVLGRYPGGGASSGYIDDMSDGDDEDSDQNEQPEEEFATAADVWSRCVTTFPADAV